MPDGKVKWYDAEKGFGFLSQEDGEDVYVRSSALPAGVEGLKAGQRVEFGLASGRRGPQALSVKLIDLKVEAIMTSGPKTISPDQLASEALELLNSSKKTQLIVVDDDNKPVGIVHVHDLLRAGVA